MKIFLTADLHFGHAEIIEYEKRPFDNVDAMDAALISNWNSVVGEKDTVIVAGDFSFYDACKTKEILTQLNGKKILVKGNHDQHSNEWYFTVGFDEISSNTIIYNEWFVISHEPPQYYNSSMPFFYIYGHVHGTELYPTVSKQSACVCVERWNYKPVRLSDLFSKAMEQNIWGCASYV